MLLYDYRIVKKIFLEVELLFEMMLIECLTKQHQFITDNNMKTLQGERNYQKKTLNSLR